MERVKSTQWDLFCKTTSSRAQPESKNYFVEIADHRAVKEVYDVAGADGLLDVAVLEDLHEGCAAVVGGFAEHGPEVLHKDVDAAGHKAGISAEGNGTWLEGVVQRAHRGGLGLFAYLGGR